MSADSNQASVDLVATTITPTELVPVPVGPDTTIARRTQRGMVSAEWTVGIIAAVAVAGVLFAVVTAGPVEKALLNVILAIIDTFV